jgi:hypothetical protein
MVGASMSKLVKICVPSKGRAELFAKKTFRILEHTKLPWSVFVEPQDEREYKKLIPHSRIEVLGRDNKRLGYALASIRDHCLEEGIQFVWKMDDDVNHWYCQTRVSPKEDQGKFLDDVRNLLKSAKRTLKKRLGGFSFPGHFRHEDWRDFTHVNKMFETTYIVNTRNWFVPPVLEGYHEEFVATSYLVKGGYVLPRVGKYCWTADLSVAEGGLQSFDRVKEQEDAYKLLEEEYPELAEMTRKRMYPQKSGLVFPVTDKTFYNKNHSRKLKLTNPEEALKECLNAN